MAKKPKEISPEDRQWMSDNELTDAETIIRRSVGEYSDSLTRAAAERDLQKDIAQRCKDLTHMSPKMFKRLAKTHWAASFNKDVAEHEEFVKLYENVLEK